MIQIDQSVSGLPTVTFADSSSLQVGDTVVTLGNALGQGGAPHVTQGQVTALNQTITASEGAGSAETLSGMIQSDAVIYQGDSGGALVNTSSQVVGMITAGQAQGFRSAASDIGYAIAVEAQKEGAELPDLTRKVLEGNIHDRKTIKQMIKTWEADWLRA